MLYSKKPIPNVFPKVRFKAAEAAVARMHEYAMTNDLYGEQISTENYEDLVTTVCQGFGESSPVRRMAVHASLAELTGQVADRDLMHGFFNRMAHNVESLGQGFPVGRWHGQLPEDEWTAVHVLDLDEVGHSLKYALQVCWGPMYGVSVTKATLDTDPGLYRMLWKLGVRTKPAADPRELVNLRFWAELVSRSGELGFARYITDTQLDRTNAEVLRSRRKACPRQYTWPCVKCPVGYDKCPAGCRRVTKQGN